ncbi:hypothetical protein Tco_1287578 [Tanacetum coccineum]
MSFLGRHVARLSTLHLLKFPENSFEVLKLLENSVEVLKILENKLESMRDRETISLCRSFEATAERIN